jgi:hypothetical protein
VFVPHITTSRIHMWYRRESIRHSPDIPRFSSSFRSYRRRALRWVTPIRGGLIYASYINSVDDVIEHHLRLPGIQCVTAMEGAITSTEGDILVNLEQSRSYISDAIRSVLSRGERLATINDKTEDLLEFSDRYARNKREDSLLEKISYVLCFGHER